MVISIKHYQSKKNLYFLLNSFLFFGLNSIFTINFQSFPWWHIFPWSIIYLSPLFSKSTRSQAEHPRRIQSREKKLFWTSPFRAGRRIVLIVKTLTSMFKQLPICDLDFVLIKYHAIEISSLLYNCPLWMVSVSKQTFLREMNHICNTFRSQVIPL